MGLVSTRLFWLEAQARPVKPSKTTTQARMRIRTDAFFNLKSPCAPDVSNARVFNVSQRMKTVALLNQISGYERVAGIRTCLWSSDHTEFQITLRFRYAHSRPTESHLCHLP